ncbi:hypothetical protein NPIL_115151 [Nephila pilipes]|uniref:Uncharacterized protein n=1 Tax=Nephila pilipes TaxID=299642 RepID=A0A8X6IC59_NEPPI|nr:hypothetical protein NPIL_115151 [Nephila pilipes]
MAAQRSSILQRERELGAGKRNIYLSQPGKTTCDAFYLMDVFPLYRRFFNLCDSKTQPIRMRRIPGALYRMLGLHFKGKTEEVRNIALIEADTSYYNHSAILQAHFTPSSS